MKKIRKNRLQAVCANMHELGLPQILVTDTSSVYYLTGEWVVPMERMLALLIKEDGTCLRFGNALFGLQPMDGTQLFVHTDADDPLRDLVKALSPGVLGIDKTWASRFLIPLMEKRPDVQIKLGSAPVDLARMCKDAEEIAALRRASQCNDAVMQASIQKIRGGMTETELSAVVEQEYLQHGAQRPPEGLITSFGENGADPHHSPADDVRLQHGDSIVMDIYTTMDRYWCDMTRTVFFGEVSDEQRRVYDLVRAANEAAEAMIRPGIPMSDIDAAARRVIEEGGYGPQFTHRLGHGLGIDCHEPPDNSASDHTLTKPGMVFSVEPGIYLPGNFGVRIEDLVLVTETGCEVLNHAPKDLLVVK